MLDQFQPISKAIAGAVAGALVSWLGKKGFAVDSEALAVVLGALITGAVVFFAPKNTEVKKGK